MRSAARQENGRRLVASSRSTQPTVSPCYAISKLGWGLTRNSSENSFVGSIKTACWTSPLPSGTSPDCSGLLPSADIASLVWCPARARALDNDGSCWASRFLGQLMSKPWGERERLEDKNKNQAEPFVDQNRGKKISSTSGGTCSGWVST